MGDNTKLSSAADFFPAALREHATEFNRLRAMPSSPQRTTACDQLVSKALTKCMELGASGSVLESVVDDALKGSQGEILIGLLYVRVRVGSGRSPSESRWSLVLHLLENTPLFLQNIARAVVQEVAVAKLVPIRLLNETMEVVQRQGSIKDFDAAIRKPWMDTVMPLLERLRSMNAPPPASAPLPVAGPERATSPVRHALVMGARRPGSHERSDLKNSGERPGSQRGSQRGMSPPPGLAQSPPTNQSPPNPGAAAVSSTSQLREARGTVGSSAQLVSLQATERPASPPTPMSSPPRRDMMLPEARSMPVESVYLFGKQLGKGSFATVFEGMHKQSRTPVALKVIPKLKVGSPEAQQMLRNEVSSLLALNHPHIVRLFDVFEDSAKFTLVLELLRGREMFDKLVERGRYSEQDASAAMRQVFEAVAYLHSNKIAHRDLKPENLLSVERGGREVIKVADFGLARSFGDGGGMNTACGSPLYVAPEVLRGLKYGPEVDMWACGVILFVILSGVAPFPNGPNVDLLFHAIQSNKWGFGLEWKSVSADAADLVTRLMEPDPQVRYTALQALQHPWILSAAALPSVPLNAAYTALSRARLPSGVPAP